MLEPKKEESFWNAFAEGFGVYCFFAGFIVVLVVGLPWIL